MIEAQNLKIGIAGTGRLAWNLCNALMACGFRIAEVTGRSSHKISQLATHCLAEAVESPSALSPGNDLFVLAVNDDAVETVAALLPETKGLVVHTSGMKTLGSLKGKFTKSGVFYPLHSFSFERQPDFSSIPVIIQASDGDSADLLLFIGNRLSQSVVSSTDEQRQTLHLAAVFVNNFSNALYTMAQEILHEKQLSISILHPLMLETVLKVGSQNPLDAQTGPARRNDSGTIERHLLMLAGKPDLLQTYQLMTDFILKKYYHKKDE